MLFILLPMIFSPTCPLLQIPPSAKTISAVGKSTVYRFGAGKHERHTCHRTCSLCLRNKTPDVSHAMASSAVLRELQARAGRSFVSLMTMEVYEYEWDFPRDAGVRTCALLTNVEKQHLLLSTSFQTKHKHCGKTPKKRKHLLKLFKTGQLKAKEEKKIF